MLLLFLSHVAKFRELIIPLVLLVPTPENLTDVDKLLTLTHEQLSFTLQRGVYSLELWLY
jgi:multidrug efflux pump subunit AcrB